MSDKRLLVEIPTKNRNRVLGRCLAALLTQTFQDFDIYIGNDNPKVPVDSDVVAREWIRRHTNNRGVWVEPGTGRGQVYIHNRVLWEPPWSDYQYIMRLDDDVLLNIYAIERMVRYLDDHPDVGAVSGLWFEHESNDNWFSDRDVPTEEEWKNSTELFGKVLGGVVSNWHQRLYHNYRPGYPDGQEVEHIYSTCVYRPEAMRKAGGWPEIYSQGVHHGEETDGTFRLYLSGWKLVVLPQVVGHHLREAGGIRSEGSDIEHMTRMVDDPMRNRRLQKMPGKYKPGITVGVLGQHTCFTGGGPRFFYEVVEALQSEEDITTFIVGEHMGIPRANRQFGLSLKPTDYPPKDLDVLICIGDDIGWLHNTIQNTNIPKAEATAFIAYFPFNAMVKPIQDEFISMSGISMFTCEQIANRWGYRAGCIYPLARKVKPLEKENWIIVVGRIDQWKGTLWMMQAFEKMRLEGWQLHIVGATEGSRQTDYIDQVKSFADANQDIFIHYDVSQAELDEFYGRAKILWAAKGILALPDKIEEAEHFGLTPIEAMSANCVPLVYDLGGHRETVHKDYRWTTEEQLIQKTKFYASDTMQESPKFEIERFTDKHRFNLDVMRIVYHANAQSVKMDRVSVVEVINRRKKLAVISDAPPRKPPYGIYTGFGVVANQIVPGFTLEDLEVHYYAILDRIPARPNEFDFTYWPMSMNDLQGEQGLVEFLKNVRPDAIWTLYDPGNLQKYLIFGELSFQAKTMDGNPIPTVVYFPVEGKPIPPYYADLVEYVGSRGGKAFTYCQSGANAMKEQFSLKVGVAHHGADHADFRLYAEEDRKMLRKLVGLDDMFIVGSMGVNKRVKQYDTLIYTARTLKDWNQHDGIRFYVHTEPTRPILQGYPLEWMAEYYDVSDMFIWKPDRYRQRGGQYTGAPFQGDTLGEAKLMTVPPTAAGRGFLFGHYDIISRFNCMDMFLDVSSVEGWNLPLTEAMACGIPSATVDDGLVRTEIFSPGAYMMEPSSVSSTWHIGPRLDLLDPITVAQTILLFKRDKKLRERLSEQGRTTMAQYKWEDTRNIMVNAVKGVLGIA